MELVLTVAGQQVRLNRDQVVSKLRGEEPGRTRSHVVEVEGVVHPVKEAFARVTGLDPLDFNTNQARAAFKKLGFKVTRIT